ncbi:MAG: ABC transporter ATP-binding protein [Cyanobacteria bacterium]|nr:ABC transporter ATP-binding protein [Cyanobacteriota bacterium]MDA1020182.1 ABC transporter ATP-binding protein [Cyanobacteriota bacterium]
MNKTITKLINTGKEYQFLFFFSIFCMFFSGFAGILPSWFVKVSIDGLAALKQGQESLNILPKQLLQFIPTDIVNSGYFNLDPHKIQLILPLTIIVVFAIDAVFKFLFQYNSRKLGLLIVKKIREQIHQHISKLSLMRQKKYDSGSIVSVISSDLNSMQSWLAESLMNIFNESIKATFLLAWLLVLDVKLTLISMVVIPMFAFPVLKVGKDIRNYARQGQDYIGKLTSFVAETLRNQTVIKSFNLELWRDNKFETESSNLYKLNKRWIFFMSLVSPMTNLIGSIGIALILFLGLSAVQSGSLSIGEFSSFFVSSILLYDPVKRLGRVSTIAQSALGVADRVYEFLDEPVQVIVSTNQEVLVEPVLGSLEFKDVSFSYDGKELFKDLNLKIPECSSVALVGPSGGGKSSLVSLIPRFFEVDSGKILLDGVNTARLALDDLRNQIAIVNQEPLLFSGTIRENIMLGRLNASEEELMMAAKESFVLEFAQTKGLDAEIGEMGNNLSIGQKQRLSIARAFISKAPIVILDEPTSALDNDSQEFIYQAITKMMQTKTVIIIAHRLSTVKHCDRIVYIENGKIVESGSHDELVRKDQAYAALLN